jgi:hypothetical protein
MRILLPSNFVSFESGSAALMPWGPPFPDAVEVCEKREARSEKSEVPASPDDFGNIQGDQLRFLSKSVKTDSQGTCLLRGNSSITWPDQDFGITLSVPPV